jgi:hypothetical protein
LKSDYDLYQSLEFGHPMPYGAMGEQFNEIKEWARLRKHPLFSDLKASTEAFLTRLSSDPERNLQWLDSLPDPQRRSFLKLVASASSYFNSTEDPAKNPVKPLQGLISGVADPKRVGITGEVDDRALATGFDPSKMKIEWIILDKGNPTAAKPIPKGAPKGKDPAGAADAHRLTGSHGEKPKDALKEDPLTKPKISIKPETMIDLVLALSNSDRAPPPRPTDKKAPPPRLWMRWNEDLQEKFDKDYVKEKQARRDYRFTIGQPEFATELLAVPKETLIRKYGNQPWGIVADRNAKQLPDTRAMALLTGDDHPRPNPGPSKSSDEVTDRAARDRRAFEEMEEHDRRKAIFAMGLSYAPQSVVRSLAAQDPDKRLRVRPARQPWAIPKKELEVEYGLSPREMWDRIREADVGCIDCGPSGKSGSGSGSK